MSVEIYSGKERWPEGFSSGTPVWHSLQVPLAEPMLSDTKLIDALKRIAKRYCKTHQRTKDGDRIIGMAFTKLEFKFMLAPPDDK